MASYRAYFGGKVPGADDAFAGAEDVVPTCAEESQLVWLLRKHGKSFPKGLFHNNDRKCRNGTMIVS